MFPQELPIHHSKVLIIGNRSYKNLGDELILLGTVKLLLKQNNKIVIQAYDSKRLRSFLRQFVDMSKIIVVTEIPKGARSMLRYIKTGKFGERATLYTCDTVIVGGGEILTEENPNSYWYWLVSLLPSLMRKLFKQTQIYLMGGIQIPQKRQNKILFNFLLTQTKAIWARDKETVQALTTYGYKNASFFMDTAYFAYNWPKHTGKSDKSIIINLNKNGAHFIDKLIVDMKDYVDQDYTIHYVPVSKGSQNDYNDIEYLDLIQEAYPTAKINILDRESDFATFVNKISKASLVISSRLHLFLIASFMGVKTKVYPYQKKILKMQNVIEKHFR